MKLRLSKIITIAAGVFFTTIMPAQELSLLPQDPAVKCGVLPNGLSCYVTANASSEGIADFALVRRDYTGNETVLSLEDVLTSAEQSVDSTLLLIMKQVEADAVPADQAVVVSGDVDAASVIMKLKYMSLMIASSAPSPLPDYKWEGDGKLNVSSVRDTLKGLSTVRCEWNAARAPWEYMNTVQSAIYEKAVWEMGKVAQMWIRRNLRELGVPVADVMFRYSGNVRGVVDEKLAVEVTVALRDEKVAENQMLAVLSALDQGNVADSDLLLAENEYMLSLERLSGRPVIDNGEYVRMCTDAFLYNRPLSGARERLDYFVSKDVPARSRKKIFTGIVSALLDVASLTDTVAQVSSGIMLSDTLALPGMGVKQKVKSSRKDPFSGGVVWTFANGFKVIYKKMPTGRTLYYSLSLNGGYANVDDLCRGEGAYMSDFIDNSWICGMRGREFKDLLQLSGMTMKSRVNLHNTVISGQVKDRNAGLMMKGILAVAGGCKVDTASVKYYVESERLSQLVHKGKDVRAALDSLMCPGYRYTSFKTEEGLQESTFDKAEILFESLVFKMNDGILVIVGDMSESELKKLLQMYVGGFKVKSVASRRPSLQYRPMSSWMEYSVEGYRNAAVVAVSGMVPMTASNHFAAEIAAMMMERKVKERFADRNIAVRLSYARNIYPDERFSIFVMMEGDCSQEDAAEIRKVLGECSRDLDERIIQAYKNYVKNAYALQMQNPEYWMHVIPLRHMEGKDFTTGYAAKIDAVTTAQVKDIFKTLEDGAGVEYIIKEK